MFLTPEDQRPFFGGTYFPTEPRVRHAGVPRPARARGRSTTANTATEIARAERRAGRGARRARRRAPAGAGTALLDDAPLAGAARSSQRDFDGASAASAARRSSRIRRPRVPAARLARRPRRRPSPTCRRSYMATLTLEAHGRGRPLRPARRRLLPLLRGRDWMIPHFEKMLYDNGPLLALYAQARVATGDALFARVAARDRRLGAARHAVRRKAASTRRSTPTPRARKAGSTSGRRTRSRALLDAQTSTPCSRARFGLDRPAELRGAALAPARVRRRSAEVASATRHRGADARARLDAARAKLLAARDAARVAGPRRQDPDQLERADDPRHGARGARRFGAPTSLDVRGARRWTSCAARCGTTAGCSPRTRTAARISTPISTTTRSSLDALLELAAGALARTADLEFARRMRRRAARALRGPRAPAASSSRRRPRGAHPPRQALRRRRDARGQRRRGAALQRLGYLLGEPRYLDAAERTLRAAWPLIERYPHAHTSLLWRSTNSPSRRPWSAARSRGRSRRVARGARQAVRPAPRRVRDSRRTPRACRPHSPTSVRQAGVVAYLCRGTTCSAPLGTLGELVRALKAGNG